ncbi:NAD-dependent succinate-semialdehyde dehydrogenase [Emcibacter nanhaiensis]|uniref:NAD-dependent succinate-semialdehyde dehydrogenase n=2 Tax=Emcibacter nanhaiensis TaxID=1505037 RepID=A0A501P9V3_9PROT|nr:NAD-dependent succinate-semialdehyde dehydrogenase [Emcibacter nanhaiensis]TPD56842.1 NAD-dependent succinate-semialdehyde dehydrogenase [Emcibacter nanhaiensis]
MKELEFLADYLGQETGLLVLNPVDDSELAVVRDWTVTEVEAAVEKAETAFGDWSKRTAKERSAVLTRWYNLIMEHQEMLARIITAECGKPLAEAWGEVAYGASFIEWFAEEGKRLYGDMIPAPGADKRIMVLKQPIGVVSAITPWNFPNAMITRKVAPALAAGCTAIVKPAEATPLSALALQKLALEAGLPEDCLQIVTTTKPAEIGRVLTTHPTIRKFSFTGSTAVGKLLAQQCAGTVKKVSLELGGNAPFIVFDDADLEAAIRGAMASKYRNAGQTCVCANRFYVQDGIHDTFVARLTEEVDKLKVGDGAEEGITVGPLINRAAVDKVEGLVEASLAAGATAATGGGRHDFGENYFEPTVLTNLQHGEEISRAEIFGPVAPVFRFQDEQDVIRMANDTPYGLAAYFYARDLGRVFRVAEALEYGMVGINEGIISTEVAPFGGVKESGIGREGSRYGIDDYVELKYCLIGGL